MAFSAGNEAAPSKRKSRRSSRQVDAPVPCHYGPVACTSSASLVQAYLAVDPPVVGPAHTPRNGGSNGNGSQASSSTCSLHMSESRFDPIKLRFGGKSKPVCSMACSADLGADGVVGNKGAHLNFGAGVKVVATSEAMNTALHCRCVFVLLLYEAPSETAVKASSSSYPSPSYAQGETRTRQASPTVQPRGRQIDTAHLIALSPDDLFLALSVDSFPVVVSPSEPKEGGDQGGSDQCAREPTVVGALPRAFEVLDGPVVVHRPVAKPDEPWRGLEVFRAEPTRVWKGQLVFVPPLGDGSNNGISGCRGGGSDGGGTNSGTAFRLDLAAASSTKEFCGATRPDEVNPRSKIQSGNGCSGTVGELLVCPASSSSLAAVCLSGSGPEVGRWGDVDGGGYVGIRAPFGAVLAVPALSSASASIDRNEKAIHPPPFSWASLSFDRFRRASLSPWRSTLPGCSDTLTCLCRAPAMDSGVVSLAQGSTTETGMPAGLVVNPPPSTVYVGVANGASVRQSTGGSLMELQGGVALSCSRSLPAPPWAVMTAAVDDARGVLAVLLSDAVGTTLLLARDGCELAIVEEYRGVASAHVGDFLGNGREQVALFPMVYSAATASSGGGAASVALQRPSTPMVAKPGDVTWDQLPLKAIVKRALVTDCSCVWGNGRRDDLAALPGVGPIQVGGGVAIGAGSGDVGRSGGIVAGDSLDVIKGRKRQRTETDHSRDAEGREGLDYTSMRDGDNRLARLSTVVGVLRRRVLVEEARLLKLRQTRRGKAAALEVAELALVARVEGGFNRNSSGVAQGHAEASLLSSARTFYDGQTGLVADGASSNVPSWVEQGIGNPSCPPLRCEVALVRFHAPSRTLCFDARVFNPIQTTNGDVEKSSAVAVSATDVSISLACVSGRLTTRSAVCRRLCPGENATIRACAEVPPWVQAGEVVTPLYASCTWCTNSCMVVPAPATDVGVAAERQEFHTPSRHCTVFARVLVSPQDMLGVGPLASSGVSPSSPALETRSGVEMPSALCLGSSIDDRCTGFSGGGSSNGKIPLVTLEESSKNLGMFDVGVRLDLLVRSDDSGTTLTALPQALRSLSAAAASLPEPWAGGAAARFDGCSERAAACTLRSSDSPGAPAVILRVAAGALPDGARASADHASEEGRALMAAATAALREEIAALEGVAKVRHRGGVGDAEREGEENEGIGAPLLSAALERYRTAQMESDLLASRLVGRVVAARGGVGDIVGGPRAGRRQG